jgi:hypothetical protein
MAAARRVHGCCMVWRLASSHSTGNMMMMAVAWCLCSFLHMHGLGIDFCYVQAPDSVSRRTVTCKES